MLSYKYISHSDLAPLISSGSIARGEVAVVDCRDEDYEGGNIPGAIHAPSEQRTEQSVQELVTRLRGVPRVVFHCSLSQVRGPKTARIYAEAAAAVMSSSSTPSSRPLSSDVPAPSATTTDPISAEVARNFSPNPFGASGSSQSSQSYNGQGESKVQQEVLVLRDGFKNWQGLYRNDPLLVENFDSRHWQSYPSSQYTGSGSQWF
ncbi:hypothetical protein JCM11641_001744 [Rhodosporidiobolus odoratus]